VSVRGGFTVKLMKLKLQGPSFARTPCKAMGGALHKYSLLYLIFIRIFYSFLNECQKFYKLQAPQNLNPFLVSMKLW
jgi:hypothetical protein